jgi:hypothetical protein
MQQNDIFLLLYVPRYITESHFLLIHIEVVTVFAKMFSSASSENLLLFATVYTRFPQLENLLLFATAYTRFPQLENPLLFATVYTRFPQQEKPLLFTKGGHPLFFP